MKKLGIVLGLVLTLIAPHAFAEKITLQFWTTWGGIRHEAWLPIVEQFNKEHPDIQIEAVDRSAYPEPLFTAVAGGVPPDLVGSSIVWTKDHAERGVLASLTPYIQREGLTAEFAEDLIPDLKSAVTYDGEMYAIPMNAELYWTFANRTVLNQAGVSEPPEDWTWDDLRSTLRKIVRVDGSGNFERIAAIANRGAAVMYFMEQAGSRWTNDAGTKVLINNDATRQAFEYLYDLQDSNLLIPDTDQYSRVKSFEEGLAAFSIDGSQRTGVHANAMDKGSFFVPYVTVGPGGKAARASSLTVSMVKTGDPKREAAAWEAVKYLGSTESQARYNAYVHAFPVRHSSIAEPVYQAALSDDDTLTQWATRVLPYAQAKSEPMAIRSVISEVWNTVVNIEERPPLGTYLEQVEQRATAALRGEGE